MTCIEIVGLPIIIYSRRRFIRLGYEIPPMMYPDG
jgi:hypothetical protein